MQTIAANFLYRNNGISTPRNKESAYFGQPAFLVLGGCYCIISVIGSWFVEWTRKYSSLLWFLLRPIQESLVLVETLAHTPEQPSERERIISSGNYVEHRRGESSRLGHCKLATWSLHQWKCWSWLSLICWRELRRQLHRFTGTWRLNGELEVSRALGDYFYRDKGLIPDPDIIVRENIDDGTKQLVISQCPRA